MASGRLDAPRNVCILHANLGTKRGPDVATWRSCFAKCYGVQAKWWQTKTATVKTTTRRNDDRPKRRQQFSDYFRQPKRRREVTVTVKMTTHRSDDKPKRQRNGNSENERMLKWRQSKRRHNSDKLKRRQTKATTSQNDENDSLTISHSQNDNTPKWQQINTVTIIFRLC